MNFTIFNYIQLMLLNTNLLTTKIHQQNSLENSEIIEISNGKLLGQIHNNYISFKSIPYAEPPIGENRFESPKPYLEKWHGIRDSRKYTHEMCLQLKEHVFGDENCLYLNIFIPKLKSIKLYPIIVFIHGGSFNFGSGNDFPIKNIMKNGNFIYVSINYRLGAFGFLSTQDTEISGNMGLKDQRLALKWIKKNIRNFNGNPNEILLCGWSAGGASVHYHLLSNGTENLIKAAVSFSGTALNSWAFDNSPLRKLNELAKSLDCPTNNTKIIKNCLKNVLASNITLKSYNFLTRPFGFPSKGFTPVVESSLVKDRFIDDLPENNIRNSKIANIPWLVSYTAEESATYAPILLTELPLFNQIFNTVVPLLLYLDDDSKLTTQDLVKLIADLKLKYNLPKNITEKDYCNLQKLFSNEHMISKTEKSVRLHQEYGKSPVFLYNFDYPPHYSYGQLLTNSTDINFGTGHGDDMQLIFNLPNINNYEDKNSEKISKNIIKMLVNFIKTGIPIYDDIKLPGNVNKSDVIKYLNIANDMICVKSKKIDLI